MENSNITEVTSGAAPVLLQEQFLKYLPASNPGMVCIVKHSDMQVLFINEQFTHYMGYLPADIQETGLCFKDLLEDYQYDHLAHQLSTVDNNLAARSAYVIYRLKNKAGEQMPYYLYAAPFKAEDLPYGRLYFLLLMPDLSKWGVPFTSFESKELFLQQFKGEDFGTFEWIMEVNKIYFSAGLQKILETELGSDINARSARSFVHPNDIERVEAEGKLRMGAGEDIDTEFQILTARSNVKTIHCLARLVKDSQGKPIKLVGSVRDVTRQRAIEADLKNKVDQLYHSNRELEEFAYVASHDLQEPLRKITTFSDRLSEKYKDVLKGDGELYLSRMTVSAENMRRLINDLLEFSRVSKVTQPFEQVELDNTLKQVKMELELVIEETGTSIVAQPLPAIEAISSQMKQLFANIINNAIKFRKEGVAPVITITCEAIGNKEKLAHGLAPRTTYYKIQVTDNGIGFEEEYATRIFQVFQRLHGKSEYPGSGIGLSICKKIAEYHHGIIYAENIPDTGARFTFILPAEQ